MHYEQTSLFDFVRFRTPRRRREPPAGEAERVAQPVARDKSLSEKTLPAMGASVRYREQTARYTLSGVMLCGPTCYVLLRTEGVIEGAMKVEMVEALTLA